MPSNATDTAQRTAARLGLVGISISFRGVHALREVTFDVQPGSVTALIGPNGAGKTTLFNCICGLNRARGRITLDDVDISAARPAVRAQAGIARTFQTPALVPEWTVLENAIVGDYPRGTAGPFAAFLRPRRENRDTRIARADALELLDEFGLRGLADIGVAQVPHGIRRRVEIVRALMGRPRLLLLDEPAAGLGPEESFPVFETLLGWQARNNTTIVLVEHSMDLVMRVAERIVVLDAGSVIADGTAAEVRANPAVIEAYLGG